MSEEKPLMSLGVIPAETDVNIRSKSIDHNMDKYTRKKIEITFYNTFMSIKLDVDELT